MRLKCVLPALVLGVGLFGLAVVPSGAADKADSKKPTTVDAKTIDKLIEQLSSDSFEERQGATKKLGEIGEPALKALRKATTSTDAERKIRALTLVSSIEKRLNSARLLSAKEVHLVFKDTPLPQAVAEIAKKTGYTIKLHDPEGKLKGKKITLDTGKTTFWDAMEKFCARANLIEGDPNQANRAGVPGAIQPGVGRPGGGVKVLPIQVKPIRIQPIKGKPIQIKPAKKADPKEEKKEEKPSNAAAQNNTAAQVAQAQQAQPARPAQARPVKARPIKAPAVLPAQQPGAAPGAPGIGAPPAPVAYVNVQPGEIYLMPGKPAKKDAYTKTSIRVRGADTKKIAVPQDNTHNFAVLELTPEPRLRVYRVGAVKVDRAIDNNDQKLESVDPTAGRLNGPNVGVGIALPGGGPAIMPAFPGGGLAVPYSPSGLYHYAMLKFKKGTKETKSLKQVSGTVAVSLLEEAEQMLAVENLMKSAGKTIKGKKGGEIKVNKIAKAKDGTITINFEMEMPSNVLPETQANIPIPAELTRPVRPGVRPVPQPAPAPLPRPGAAPAKPGQKGNAAAQTAEEKKKLEEKKAAEQKAKAAQQAKQAAQQKAQVQVRQAQPGVIQIQVQIGGGGNVVIAQPFGGGRATRYAINGLTLRDAKGKPIYAQIRVNYRRGQFNAKRMEYIATYKPYKGMPAEPTKLVFTGRQLTEINVPFDLKNVDVK